MQLYLFFCFFKQKTAYEMRISDWSSDVCSSDLATAQRLAEEGAKVVIGDINFPGAKRGAAAIVANGGEADARHLDISDEESIRQFYRFVQDRHGDRKSVV